MSTNQETCRVTLTASHNYNIYLYFKHHPVLECVLLIVHRNPGVVSIIHQIVPCFLWHCNTKSFAWKLNSFKPKGRAGIFAYKPPSSFRNKEKKAIDSKELLLLSLKWSICLTHIHSVHSIRNEMMHVVSPNKSNWHWLTVESSCQNHNTASWCIVSYVK